MKKHLAFVMIALFLSMIFNATPPAFAADSTITFKVNLSGESHTVAIYSSSDLEQMPQTQQIYSSLDQSPSPVIVMAEGIQINTWLDKAGIDKSTIEKVKLKSSDNWSKTFNNRFLFQTERYYYPSIVEKWTESGLGEGADIGKVAVTPVLALKSSEKRYDKALDWKNINDKSGIRLCFGQENIQSDVNSSYGKNINEVEFYLNDRANYEAILKTVEKNVPGQKLGVGDSVNPNPNSNSNNDLGGRDNGQVGLVPDTLTIKVGYYGGPYFTKKVYSRADLEKMAQTKQAYTWIDKMPAVVMDSARGVKMEDILSDAGIDLNSIETFYFYCKDVSNTWYQALPKSYLLDTNRYYYPNLPQHWDTELQSSTFGATADAKKVETMIAVEDNWKRFGTEPDFSNMTKDNSFRLVFGQTDATSSNAARSARWIHSIEVMLGGTPPKDVVLNKNMLELKVGSTFQLQATVKGDEKVDKRIKWNSSNPEAVKVDENGNITVLKDSEAVITVSTVNGNKAAVCVINGEDKKSISKSNEANVKKEEKPTKLAVADGSGKQPWRVYEISDDAVAMATPKQDKSMALSVGAVFLVLYFIGVFYRFRFNKQEVF